MQAPLVRKHCFSLCVYEASQVKSGSSRKTGKTDLPDLINVSQQGEREFFFPPNIHLTCGHFSCLKFS